MSAREFAVLSRRGAPLEERLRLPGIAGALFVAALLGLLAAKGYGLAAIAILVVGGTLLWVLARPTAPLVLAVGVFLLPTPAMGISRVYGVPLTTTLAMVTLVASLAIWYHQKARGLHLAVNRLAIGALAVFVLAALAQLAISRYAALKPVYQFTPFWLAGLLLGSVLAADRRLLDHVGLLAVPLALLAVGEFALGKPNLWGDLVGAHGYDNVAQSAGTLRATSTFGHPVVAGAALIVMAFVFLARSRSSGTILFSIIVAGAVATVSRSALVGLGVGLLAQFLGTHRQRLHVMGALGAVVVLVWLMVALIPPLNTAFNNRVLGASTRTERIRLNSLQTLKEGVSSGDSTLLAGRGLGGSIQYLSETGGNLGFSTYDNQYVTSLYDSGFLVVLAGFGLIVIAVARNRPGWRVVAPLAAAAATMFFFEGLYWPVTGLLFWLAVGLATAPIAGAGAHRASSGST